MKYDDDKIIQLIDQLRSDGAEFCVATVVRTQNATSAKAGAKAVITKDGEIKGFLGGSCVLGAVRQSAEEVLDQGEAKLIRVRPKDEVLEHVDVDGVELHKSSCPSGGTVEIFVEPMRLAPNLVVCGASPVATALAKLGADMGYHITGVALEDDLEKFGNIDRAVAGFDLSDARIGKSSFIVVATQGKRDREALTAALNSDAGYVAFVGSRRKAQSVLATLRDNGIDNEKLARLSAPAGLDINAIEPVEIALSILGEIVALRRQGSRKDQSILDVEDNDQIAESVGQ